MRRWIKQYPHLNIYDMKCDNIDCCRSHAHTLQAFHTVDMFCHNIHGLRAEKTVVVRLEMNSTPLHCHGRPEVGDEATPHGGRLDWFTGHAMCWDKGTETNQKKEVGSCYICCQFYQTPVFKGAVKSFLRIGSKDTYIMSSVRYRNEF